VVLIFSTASETFGFGAFAFAGAVLDRTGLYKIKDSAIGLKEQEVRVLK